MHRFKYFFLFYARSEGRLGIIITVMNSFLLTLILLNIHKFILFIKGRGGRGGEGGVQICPRTDFLLTLHVHV